MATWIPPYTRGLQSRIINTPYGPRLVTGEQFAQQGGQRFTFDKPQARMDLAGARSYDQDLRNEIAMERERRTQEYQRMHEELAMAKERREEEEHRAKVEQRLKYEALMQKAIPMLFKIDPADPDASKKRYEIAQQFPQLFHSEKDIPSLAPYFEQHERLSEGARKQQEEINARKEAAQSRSDDINQRHQESLDARRQSQQQHEDLMRELAADRAAAVRDSKLGTARIRYESANSAADALKDRISQTEAFISEQRAKGDKRTDVDNAHLANLIKSDENLKAQLNKHTAAMKGLAAQYPELNPDSDDSEKKTPPTATLSGPSTSTQPGTDAKVNAAPSQSDAGSQKSVKESTASPAGALGPNGSDTDSNARPERLSDFDEMGQRMAKIRARQEQLTQAKTKALDSMSKANSIFGGDEIERQQQAFDNASAEYSYLDNQWNDLSKKRNLWNKYHALPQEERDAISDEYVFGSRDLSPEEKSHQLMHGGQGPGKNDPTGDNFMQWWDDKYNNENAAQPTESPSPTDVAPISSDEPHPMEGMRVKHKKTGQGGTIVNGQFVPDETEALQDQPTPE